VHKYRRSLRLDWTHRGRSDLFNVILRSILAWLFRRPDFGMFHDLLWPDSSELAVVKDRHFIAVTLTVQSEDHCVLGQ